jgi:hypothetical protein
MEGTHPFGGVFSGQGEAPELKDRIKAGHFPHGRRGIPYNPMPLAPSFRMLPVALQELFLLCFEAGHGNPAARPTADVWSKALGAAEDGLVRCGVNGQHYYSGHLGVCPWCERAAKLGGRDPFPALGGISSGQHLQPAAIGKAVGKPILKVKPQSTTNIIPSKPVNSISVVISPRSQTTTSQLLIPTNVTGVNSQAIPTSTNTNSQALNPMSLTTNTPKPTQINSPNNQTQTQRQITFWEKIFLDSNISLTKKIVVILLIFNVFSQFILLFIFGLTANPKNWSPIVISATIALIFLFLYLTYKVFIEKSNYT